jgi:hypothetical protein
MLYINWVIYIVINIYLIFLNFLNIYITLLKLRPIGKIKLKN